jgi:hypothetical protein
MAKVYDIYNYILFTEQYKKFSGINIFIQNIYAPLSP